MRPTCPRCAGSGRRRKRGTECGRIDGQRRRGEEKASSESIAIFAGDDQPTTVATGALDDPITDTEVDLAEITDESYPLSLATGPVQISDSAMETTKERPNTYTKYERERGKPVPGVNHSRLQIRLSVAFFSV